MKSDLIERIDRLNTNTTFGDYPSPLHGLLGIVRDLIHKVEELEPEEISEEEIQNILSQVGNDVEYIAVEDGRVLGSTRDMTHGQAAVAWGKKYFPDATVYLKVGGQ